MYLVVTARKGISSYQLAKELGITQKSSWFMGHSNILLSFTCCKDSFQLSTHTNNLNAYTPLSFFD
jgi:hypothetical protein